MNTSETPAGGWQYYQSQTGWSAPHPVGHTFDQQVQNIIKHRKANPAIVAKHNLALDPGIVSQELLNFQIARGVIAAPPKLTLPPSVTPQLSGAVVGAVAAVKKLAAGAATLLDWEEQGMPHVEPDIAIKRAETCSTCPKNQQGKSLTEYFTTAVSDLYNRKFQKQQEQGLTTPHDDKLFVCSACLCPLRNKVWLTNDLVLKRLKPEQRAELDPRCWILTLS